MFMLPTGGAIGTSTGSTVRRYDTGGTGTLPAIFGIPEIQGSGRVGEECSVVGYIVTGSPSPELEYSWQIGGLEVATTPTYVPTEEDAAGGGGGGFSAGFSDGFGGAPVLTCTITAINVVGSSDPATTTPITIYLSGPRTPSAAIDQTHARVGDTLTVSYTDGDDGQEATFTLQWRLNGTPVTGEVSSGYEAMVPGVVTCAVTATLDGISVTVETAPVRVVHATLASVDGAHNATTKSSTFGSTLSEVADQVYLLIVSYEGPVPTNMVVEGVTLSSFTDGASATSGGLTLTCLRGETLDTNKRNYLLALEGLTGKASVAASITTPSAFSYLKRHCYQISGYSLENLHWAAVTGSLSTLSVEMVKPIRGLGIAFVNRMPNLSVTPSGWIEGFRADSGTSQWDVLSGYLPGEAGLQSSIVFAQPSPVAGQAALAIGLSPIDAVIPEITSEPTFTGGASPVQGTAITLNIASVSANTERVRVQVWRNTTPRVAASSAVEYVIGSADPAPAYTPTAADVGFTLVQSQTPVTADGVVGAPRFSAPTGTVTSVSGGTDPAQLASNKFEFVGMAEADGGIITVNGTQVQRAKTTFKSGISQPAGWELCALRTVSSGVTAASGHADLQFMQTLATLVPTYDGSTDKIWNSGSGAADGVTQRLYVYWRHQSTGRIIDAVALVAGDTPYSFVSDTGDVIIPPPPGGFDPADELLSPGTSARIVSRVSELIAAWPDEDYIIDLPAGNYGSLNLSGKIVPGPGKLYIRSSGLANAARFTNININLAKNIVFQFVTVDRSGLTRSVSTDGFASGVGVTMQGSDGCGIQYSDINGGPIIRNPNHSSAYYEHSRHGINMDKSGTTITKNASIYMNAIHGGWLYGIRLGGAEDVLIAENVLADICGDDIQMGGGTRIDFINNWFSRVKYIVVSSSGQVFHSDWLQWDARFEPGARNCRVIGCVGMKQDWPWEGTISQGVFSSKSKTTSNVFRDIILLSNAQQGVYHEVNDYPGAYGIGHTCTNNTAIKLADGRASDNHQTTKIFVEGASTVARNIHSSSGGAGTDGINIPSSNADRDGGEAYYRSCRVASSFYEFRPIEGQATHWGYTGGVQVGAHQRFYDVIVGGAYPKIGPAAVLWKQTYDPRNQITS